MTVGWDNPRTAELYERFNARHARYREANAALVAHAALDGDLEVLDIGAGTGHTTESALGVLGDDARVVCFEPAHAMLAAGRARVRDARVTWTGELRRGSSFDRVLCGAAVWQLGPLGDAVTRLAALVGNGGALCFTIPALYLGEGDEPGAGSDPFLHELLARVATGRVPEASPQDPLPSAAGVDALLATAGLEPDRWTFRRRVTQAELRDWLAIPVLTDRLLGDLTPDERISVLDRAYAGVDRASWRWERWYGWTAWRP